MLELDLDGEDVFLLCHVVAYVGAGIKRMKVAECFVFACMRGIWYVSWHGVCTHGS